MTYARFAVMTATSTVAVYGMVHLNTYIFENMYWSQSRAWMALYMGSGMAIIMMAFMRAIYPSRGLNLAIFVAPVLVFAGSVYMLPNQHTVDDLAWMRAMIPHQSITTQTRERAQVSEPKARELTDQIN